MSCTRDYTYTVIVVNYMHFAARKVFTISSNSKPKLSKPNDPKQKLSTLATAFHRSGVHGALQTVRVVTELLWALTNNQSLS